MIIHTTWKILSANITEKPPKIYLILIQSKIPFGCTKSVALRYYFQIFTKSYRVVFEKSSLYFTSPMKISKCKCNSKTLKNPFNFDSIQHSVWVHNATGIRMLFTRFHKKLSSRFWEKFTLLHLPYENSMSKSNDKDPQNPFNFDSIKNSFWVHIDTGIRMLFTKFYKMFSSKMLTLLHLPSPLWKFLRPNVTEKPPKIHLILIQSKIHFGCT